MSDSQLLVDFASEYVKLKKTVDELKDKSSAHLTPSYNELRYAGRHFICAIEESNNLKYQVERAHNHCKRACYDASVEVLRVNLLEVDAILEGLNERSALSYFISCTKSKLNNDIMSTFVEARNSVKANILHKKHGDIKWQHFDNERKVIIDFSNECKIIINSYNDLKQDLDLHVDRIERKRTSDLTILGLNFNNIMVSKIMIYAKWISLLVMIVTILIDKFKCS